MHNLKLNSHQLKHVVNLIADDIDLCAQALRTSGYSAEEYKEYQDSIVKGAHVLASMVKGI